MWNCDNKRFGKIKYGISFVLVICMCMGLLGNYNTLAATTSEKLKNAKKELSNLENEKAKAQEDANYLKAQANELEGELKELNDSLQAVSDELTRLEGEIQEKSVEIEDATIRLDEATAVKEKQYEDMKLRIKYMYENADTDFLALFLHSKSMRDFLNAVEYIQSISDYDREQLDEYKQTCEIIDNEKTALEVEQAELEDLEEAKQSKKDELDVLVADTQQKYNDKSYEAKTAQNKADDYSAKIKEMEQLEAELEKQKAKEDKKRLEELKRQSAGLPSQSGPVAASASDAAILAAIIYCEAGGESYDGQVAVGSVIMNRVASPSYPGSISGVVYQGGQFAPVASGRFAVVLSQGLASQSCRNAAGAVLSGTRNVSACSFRGVSSGIPGTVIGNHVFF